MYPKTAQSVGGSLDGIPFVSDCFEADSVPGESYNGLGLMGWGLGFSVWGFRV